MAAARPGAPPPAFRQHRARQHLPDEWCQDGIGHQAVVCASMTAAWPLSSALYKDVTWPNGSLPVISAGRLSFRHSRMGARVTIWWVCADGPGVAFVHGPP